MKTKVSKTVNILLRIFIMLLTLAFVYKQLNHRIDWSQWGILFRETINNPYRVSSFLFVFLLFPINILIESLKWKKLIDRLEKVKLNKAYTGVLTGISVSLFLPNRVGDYFGRVFVLDKASHVQGILVTIIGSFAQWLVFFFCGGVAMIKILPAFLASDLPYSQVYQAGFVILVTGILALLCWLYFNVGLVKPLIMTVFPNKGKMFERYTEVFSLYSRKDLMVVLLYSFLRYGLFTFQFFIMLHALGLQIPYNEAITALTLMYFILTVIPTFALTEIGVRGSVSISVFSFLFSAAAFWNEQSVIVVLTASTAIWLINVIIPALMGAFLVGRLKFFREDE